MIGEWFEAQHDRAGSGTFAGVLAGEYFISTADPGNIKAILATESNNFEKGTPDRVPTGPSMTVSSIRVLRP